VAWQPRTATLGGARWRLGTSSSIPWMTEPPRLTDGRGPRARRALVPWPPGLPALDPRPRHVRGCGFQARPLRVPRLAAAPSRPRCRALVACAPRRSHVADRPSQGGGQGIERCNARLRGTASADADALVASLPAVAALRYGPTFVTVLLFTSVVTQSDSLTVRGVAAAGGDADATARPKLKAIAERGGSHHRDSRAASSNRGSFGEASHGYGLGTQLALRLVDVSRGWHLPHARSTLDSSCTPPSSTS